MNRCEDGGSGKVGDVSCPGTIWVPGEGGLARSEEAYAADVAGFRAALNAVPSTFLELYDLTGNGPTGTH
jgi:hypothetical protein